MAAVCGLSPWKTPLHVYLEKRGELPDRDSQAKRMGHRLEEVIAQMYSEDTGREVYPPAERIMSDPQHPWMLASLDRIALDGAEEIIVEVKLARYRSDEWGEPWTDQVPSQYLIQVQHQLAVTGLGRAHLVVLFAGMDLAIYDIPRSDALIGHLRALCSDFWAMVQRQEAPDPTWQHPATVALLRDRYPWVDESLSLSLPEEVERLARSYLLTQEVLRAEKRKQDETRAHLLAALGEAACGVTPLGLTVKRVKKDRKEHTVPAGSWVELHVRRPKGQDWEE